MLLTVTRPNWLTQKPRNQHIPTLHVKCKECYWKYIQIKTMTNAFTKWEKYIIFIHFDLKHILCTPYQSVRGTGLQRLQYQIWTDIIYNHFYTCGMRTRLWLASTTILAWNIHRKTLLWWLWKRKRNCRSPLGHGRITF